MFGSLLVAVAWGAQLRDEDSIALNALAGVLVAIDTGGLHWFVISVTYHWIRGRGKGNA